MTERFTPEQITALAPGEVFVFGSNAEGRHAGGAAAFAWQNCGAVWGIGEGLHGQSYAIPTMGTLSETAAAVGRFLLVAEAHYWLTFLVTKIGTGIAGWPISEIAPLFSERPPNVILPREFANFPRQHEPTCPVAGVSRAITTEQAESGRFDDVPCECGEALHG